jgi:Cd2+/Zn2+-exporting ATPase
MRQDAVNKLHSMKVKTTMLSGDKTSVVKFIADKLGIDNAFGDLLPEDKVNKVKEIKDKSETVAFVGDGVNDAPVVALSNVGIAMGGLGSDATIETADVVIQNDEPSKIAMAINIGKQTKKNRLAKHRFSIHSKSRCVNTRSRWFSHHVGSGFCRCWCSTISYT